MFPAGNWDWAVVMCRRRVMIILPTDIMLMFRCECNRDQKKVRGKSLFLNLFWILLIMMLCHGIFKMLIILYSKENDGRVEGSLHFPLHHSTSLFLSSSSSFTLSTQIHALDPRKPLTPGADQHHLNSVLPLTAIQLSLLPHSFQVFFLSVLTD